MAIKQTISGPLSQSWLARLLPVCALAVALFWLADKFWSSDSFWRKEEYAATAVVVAGCAGEYIADFKPFGNWPKKRKSFAKLSTFTLIIGLAFELLGLVRTSQITGREIASLNDESSQAKRDAETAKKQTEDGQVQIADAKGRMVEEEKELLAQKESTAKWEKYAADLGNWSEKTIEAQRAQMDAMFAMSMPRFFAPNPRRVAKFRSFAPEDVDIIICEESSEAHGFASTIALSLVWLCKWNVRIWDVTPETVGSVSLPEFSVLTRVGAIPKDKAAAAELNSELYEEEFRGSINGPPPTTLPVLFTEFPARGELKLGPFQFKVNPAYPGTAGWHDNKAASIRVLIGGKP